MMQIFNFFGGLLGYILWFFYMIVRNYGVAIILFTIVVKLLLFPMSIKQQKSMAAQTKMAAKQKELQAKYANDKMKYQEELQKLYEKEGVSPMGGCLTTLLPFPIMLGLYYSVVFPLKNVLHLPAEAVDKALNLLNTVPGIGSNFAANSFYNEIEIVKHFDVLRDHLTEIFTGDELNQIESLSHGFQFFGLDLLQTPQTSDFMSMMWLIPVLCLVSSWASQFIMMKTQPTMQQQQGCMKVMMYGMPLISVYFSYIMPGAIGFYWIISTLVSFASTLAMNRFYSPAQLSARGEARRAALRYQEESAAKELPAGVQAQLAEKLLPAQNHVESSKQETQSRKSGKSKAKKQGKSGNDAYLGTKK